MSQFSTANNIGFRACRKLGGGAAIEKTFAVSASNNEAYFIGDAVTLGTSGKVRLHIVTGKQIGRAHV